MSSDVSLFIYVLTIGLCNDAVNSSDYVASNDTAIKE
jgi:hypothetical protein